MAFPPAFCITVIPANAGTQIKGWGTLASVIPAKAGTHCVSNFLVENEFLRTPGPKLRDGDPRLRHPGESRRTHMSVIPAKAGTQIKGWGTLASVIPANAGELTRPSSRRKPGPKLRDGDPRFRHPGECRRTHMSVIPAKAGTHCVPDFLVENQFRRTPGPKLRDGEPSPPSSRRKPGPIVFLIS